MRADSRTILVVEDEFIVRIDAALQLEDLGFDVLSTGTADEALVVLEENPIDIVFTDINMPGQMSGLDLAREVRSRWPETEVVITSARALYEAELPEGARFVPKPYDITQVIQHPLNVPKASSSHHHREATTSRNINWH